MGKNCIRSIVYWIDLFFQKAYATCARIVAKWL